MPRPTDTSQFAEAVYSQLAPVADVDEQQNWALLIYIASIGEMFKQMDDLSRAWETLVNIDTVPDEGLPWLGQMIGVVVDTKLSYDQQRQQIREHVGMGRGSVPTIQALIRPYLSGSRTIVIIERDTSPYHFEIITYGDETPADSTYADIYANDPTYEDFYLTYLTYEAFWMDTPRERIRQLIQDNKPAGLQFTYTVTPGSPGTYLTYETLYIDHPSWADVYLDLQTYEDMYNNP